MGVTQLSAGQVATEAVAALGLDSTAVSLTSDEVLATSLRRAASFLCPATPRSLATAVVEALSDLPKFDETICDRIEDLVDALISYGDLLELPSGNAGGRRQLYLGPPAFVRRTNSCIILGVRPEGAPLIGGELSERIEYEGHVRFLRRHGSERLDEVLAGEGLNELRAEQWLRAPRLSTAREVVEFYSKRLAAAGQSGPIEGVRLIDPASKATYYRGRWRPLKRGDSGQFVARRPQAFGAELWCFAEVKSGEIRSLIDLPVQLPLAPGADEAWRLQAAIDASAGKPQQVRLHPTTHSEMVVLDFFSPLPSWGQRRLDIVGTPLIRSRGALFSYAVPVREVDDELTFLKELMWMSSESSREGMNSDE